MKTWAFAAIALAAVCSAGPAATAETSELWGAEGEKWTPQGRLPDFSFAGYRRGEQPFRIPAATVRVADFGAKGDGRTDDTAAFQKALAAGAGKLVLIPPGRYLLSDVLEIHASSLVLRGAGSEKTTLLFAKPLEELRPRAAKTDHGSTTTGWSWGGGLIVIGAKASRTAHGSVTVTAPARRGEAKLTAQGHGFKAGDEVVLSLQDDQRQSLVRYLYRNQPGNVSGLTDWRIRQIFRVRSAEGAELSLDRPLRFDVRAEWSPRLARFSPAVTDVGVEGVAFEFPARPYAGHFRELGYNPVVIESGAAHCWLKDLKVWNADSGPYVNGAFCTVDTIRLGADPERVRGQGYCGHHGITLQGQDCLCVNFDIQTQFIHDVTVQSAVGCVFARGRAVNLCMDHHRWAPYENLFTDIDAGAGRRLWESSGGGQRGAHTAAGETFWNIRTAGAVNWPRSLGIDAIHVVGLDVRGRDGRNLMERTAEGRWLEAAPYGTIRPVNLYEAMLRRRLNAGKGKP